MDELSTGGACHRILKGDCDIDGEWMDHTAFPAFVFFVPSSIW
jgi:hypothetical protein